jgi:hypothetical protein
MSLDESKKKYEKQCYILAALVVIGFIDLVLVLPFTIIGGTIIFVLIAIIGSINVVFLWIAKWEYYGDLKQTTKDVWKLLRRKEPPLK